MSVEVSKLVIKIGGKEIELSLAEARELLQILDDTLQPSEPRKVVERIVEREVYPWMRPYRLWETTVRYSTQGVTIPADARGIYVSNGTTTALSGSQNVMYINAKANDDADVLPLGVSQ